MISPGIFKFGNTPYLYRLVSGRDSPDAWLMDKRI